MTCCCKKNAQEGCYSPCCIYSWSFLLSIYGVLYRDETDPFGESFAQMNFLEAPAAIGTTFVGPCAGAIKSGFTDWFEGRTSAINQGGFQFTSFSAAISQLGNSSHNLVLGQPVDPKVLWETPAFPVSCDFKLRFYCSYDDPDAPPAAFDFYIPRRPQARINGCLLNAPELTVLSHSGMEYAPTIIYLEDQAGLEPNNPEWWKDNTTPAFQTVPNVATDQPLFNLISFAGVDQPPYGYQKYCEITLRAVWRGIDKAQCKLVCTDRDDALVRTNIVDSPVLPFGCYDKYGEGPLSEKTDSGYGWATTVAEFDRQPSVQNAPQDCTNALCTCGCRNASDCLCTGCTGATVDGGTLGFNVAYPIAKPGGNDIESGLTIEICGNHQGTSIGVTAEALVFDGLYPWIVGQIGAFFNSEASQAGGVGMKKYVSIFGDTATAFSETRGWLKWFLEIDNDELVDTDNCDFVQEVATLSGSGESTLNYTTNDSDISFWQGDGEGGTISSAFRPQVTGPFGGRISYDFEPDMRSPTWHLYHSGYK